MKMNEARKLNTRAVLDEQERQTDPFFEKKKAKEELYSEKKQLNTGGLSKEKSKYAFEQAG